MEASNSSPAIFLDVDLELGSAENLDQLKNHLGSAVFVLYCGEDDDGFRLAVEALIDGRLNSDPENCIDHLLKLVEALPSNLQGHWKRCRHRIFDIGFDGGYEAVPLHIDLPTNMLERIANVGGSVRITIYPHRPDNNDRENQESEA